MAKQLTTASIATGQTINAGHVTQSSVAFTGGEAYDITISGSLEITGSTDINGVLSIPGFSNVSASLATSFDGFPFTGSAGLLGTLDVNGPAGHITASGNISASGDIIAKNASFKDTITIRESSGNGIKFSDNLDKIYFDGTNIVIAIDDEDKYTFRPGGLDLLGHITASGNISASGDISGDKFISNNIQVVRHTNNTTFLGKVGTSTNIAGPITASIVSASGDIIANNITASGNISASNSSTISAGSIQSTGTVTAQSRYIIQPGTGNGVSIESGGTKVLTINTDDGNVLTNTILVTSKLDLAQAPSQIALNGHITASGNISASGEIKANNGVFNTGGISIDNKSIDYVAPNLRVKNTGLNIFGGSLTGSIISASGDLKAGKLFIDEKSAIDTYTSTVDELTLNPDATWDAIRLQRDGSPKPIILGGNVTGSGHGLFQAGKPITTHTSNLSASLAEAGFYHIVGGNLTCSISTSIASIGAEYEFFQTSSGNFLFETGSGITLISKNDSIRLAQLGSSAVLKKITADTFHLMGDLT